jgi:hypothetical protein
MFDDHRVMKEIDKAGQIVRQEDREPSMSDRQSKLHELLLQNLTELNLTQIAATYREILDEAARRNSSVLEVLSSLVAAEVTGRVSGVCSAAANSSGKTAKTEDAGGIQIRILQTDPEAENRATVRLRIHRTASACCADRTDGNR